MCIRDSLKLEAVLAQKNPILEKIYGLHTYTVEEICDRCV